MGMFDQIHWNGKVYQSNDLDCTMHNYYIENGRLFSSEGHTEDKSPATAWKNANPGKELPKELSGLSGMFGCIAWVETGRKDMNFHGWLNFYDDEEYNAKFTDGNLVEVILLKE